ncbi:hypothetical protein [Halomonas sp. BC04]|uniref:hypothetical protein n=1 Tax=Halomonas sp. BC04 TaxID=1403540 RepID=UPI0003ED64B7|nr:hypothetical protein [Halomonas sp. BC04]EWH00812.1 hypothetical protein Q427_17405 [Halomonas sp. BC04]
MQAGHGGGNAATAQSSPLPGEPGHGAERCTQQRGDGNRTSRAQARVNTSETIAISSKENRPNGNREGTDDNGWPASVAGCGPVR